jgi:hypothetical protein
VWACTFLSVLPGLLDLASPIAANAIFSLCAIALDSSYIIPIACRRIFRNHPEVQFKPGPFYMGTIGWAANITCIVWTVRAWFASTCARRADDWCTVLRGHHLQLPDVPSRHSREHELRRGQSPALYNVCSALTIRPSSPSPSALSPCLGMPLRASS